VLVEELGPEWREKFKEFEENPFSAASIGQVHRASLHSGEKVIVKVQYPGVAESVVSDLNYLKSLLLFSNFFPDGLFLDNTIRVASLELEGECNYVREGWKLQSIQSFKPFCSFCLLVCSLVCLSV